MLNKIDAHHKKLASIFFSNSVNLCVGEIISETMDSKRTKLYRSLLYLSQFLVNEEFVVKICSKLRGLNIKNESFKVALIDYVNLILQDLNEVQIKQGIFYDLSKTSRKFIKCFIIAFAALIHLTSYKRFFTNLIKFKKLDGLVELSEIKALMKISSNLAIMSSFIPFLNKLLKNIKYCLSISTILTSFFTIKNLPNNYIKDYFSLYIAAYGIESYLSYVNDKYKLNIHSSWCLIPVITGELFNNYLVHPEFVPKLLKPSLNWLLDGLFNLNSSILVSTSSSISINNDEVLKSPNYSNILKIYSIDSDLIKQVLKLSTTNFLKLSLLSIPVVVLEKMYSNYFRESKEEIKPLEILKSSLKVSSSLILTSLSCFLLSLLNDKNYRLIGYVSSLWFFLFLKVNSFNKNILTYSIRSIFLPMRLKLVKKYGDHSNLNYLNPCLSSIGLTLLVNLYSNPKSQKFITPKRLPKLLQFLITN